MNEDNTKKLVETFPSLYRSTFHFSCGDGWFEIVYNLSKEICEIVAKRDLKGDEHPKVNYIKEKFGGLRFILENCTMETYVVVQDAIQDAMKLSYETCEECGKPGKFRGGLLWYQTLCDEHYREIKSQRSDKTD